MRFHRIALIATLPLFAAAYACSDEDAVQNAGPTPTPTTTGDAAPDPVPSSDAAPAVDAGPVALALTFEARVGSEKFSCGSKVYDGIGTSAAKATAGDLRFFIHDVRLLREGGGDVSVALDSVDPWQSDKVALLDFEDKTGDCAFGTSATNDVVRGKAPAGTYNGVSFTIGVPEELNHVNADTAAAPLPGSKMNWDWTSGFIHFGAQMNSTKTTLVDAGEGSDAGVERVPPYFSHIGSTVCSGDPADGGSATCQRKNRAVVRLTGFDPTTHKIVIDAKKLYAASNIDQNTAMTIPGCMSSPTDPDCPPIFTKLGLDFDTGAPTSATPQSVFSAEPK